MKKEIFIKPFTQYLIPQMEKENPSNFIKAKKLFGLIKDEDFRDAIQKKYKLSDEDIIQIGNIDVAYTYVRHVTEKYEFLNLTGNNKGVYPFLKNSTDDGSETMFFKIDSLSDEDGPIDEILLAEAIYESSSMLYDDRKLSSYINFLKSPKGNNSMSTAQRNKLIKDVDDSWKEHYENYPDTLRPRVFRFLKDTRNNYYLRSITSELYKEYGVAFGFVVSMLALNKLMQTDKGTNFRISSLAINESKIDMVVTYGSLRLVKKINSYLSSSILISNNDLGNKSLSFKHTLEVREKKDSRESFFIFPKDSKKNINYKMASRHTDNVSTVLSMFDSLPEVINYTEEYIKDFDGFAEKQTPDELRAKIEERIKGPNSPFRGVKKLEDLFSRSTSQHINNLAQLLHICKQAEQLDIEFELKSKLRYIISDIILYGKSY